MDILVLFAFLIVGVLEIAVPVLAAYYFTRKLKVAWAPFIFGATFFIAVQVFHFPLVFLTQGPIYGFLGSVFTDKTMSLAVFSIILGLLAGLFEEVGRYIVFKHFFPSQKLVLNRQNALLFGIGWGGVESIFIALLILLTGVGYLFAAPLTPAQIDEVNKSMKGNLTLEKLGEINKAYEAFMNISVWGVIPGLFERLMTMVLHVAFTLMVFTAVAGGRKTMLLLAVLYHALVDALVVFLAGMGLGLFVVEGALFVMAVFGFFYIKTVWSRGVKN